MLALLLSFRYPTHRVCERDNSGYVTSCREDQWDPNSAQIPCSFLPPEFSECITHSFDKFFTEFENGSLPFSGCPKGHTNESYFGVAVCHPLAGIYCVGEQFWINSSYPCFEPGEYSVAKAILLSFFLGILGMDRFYLGYRFLGTLKLFTLGGFLIWWICDFILLALGVWGPYSSGYNIFY